MVISGGYMKNFRLGVHVSLILSCLAIREAAALALCRAQDLPQVKCSKAAKTPFPRSQFLS